MDILIDKKNTYNTHHIAIPQALLDAENVEKENTLCHNTYIQASTRPHFNTNSPFACITNYIVNNPTKVQIIFTKPKTHVLVYSERIPPITL